MPPGFSGVATTGLGEHAPIAETASSNKSAILDLNPDHLQLVHAHDDVRPADAENRVRRLESNRIGRQLRDLPGDVGG